VLRRLPRLLVERREPALAVYILNMDDETSQALSAMESRIMKRFEEVESRVVKRFEETDEKIREIETSLLSAFHGWSTTMELRLKSLPATEQRLSVIEDRVSAIERKLLKKGM